MQFSPKSLFCQKLNITTLDSEYSTFFKNHEIEYTPSTMFKKAREYDDSDILPSSSSLNKSYPEFYGDQCLS